MTCSGKIGLLTPVDIIYVSQGEILGNKGFVAIEYVSKYKDHVGIALKSTGEHMKKNSKVFSPRST